MLSVFSFNRAVRNRDGRACMSPPSIITLVSSWSCVGGGCGKQAEVCSRWCVHFEVFHTTRRSRTTFVLYVFCFKSKQDEPMGLSVSGQGSTVL